MPRQAEERLRAALRRIEELEAAVRRHRDSWLSGDDRCWRDNEELYKVLPEGFTPLARDSLVELENCVRYTKSCHHPQTLYVSPQRRIDELEAEVSALAEKVAVQDGVIAALRAVAAAVSVSLSLPERDRLDALYNSLRVP